MPDIYLKRLHEFDYTNSLGAACPLQLVLNFLGHELHAPSVRRDRKIGDFGVQASHGAASAP